MVERDKLSNKVPLNTLSEENFTDLLDQIQIMNKSAGNIIFNKGDNDNEVTYLISGEITLESDASVKPKIISAESEESKYALAQLRPRQYTGIAHTDIEVAIIDGEVLEKYLTLDQLSGDVAVEGYEVDVIGENLENTDWMMELLRNPAFEKLPASNIAEMLYRMESVAYQPGEVIIKQGEQGDYYYVVKSGKLNVSMKAKGGKVTILADLTAGAVFGEEALISDYPRNASVIAVSESVLMRLELNDFNELLKQTLISSYNFDAVQAMIKQGAGLIDVRTEQEYIHNAVSVSVNIPLGSLRQRVEELDVKRKYIICCLTGSRSSVAAFILNQRGFDVAILEGGLQSLPQWPQ